MRLRPRARHDLQAAAITQRYGADEAILLALEAGNDLLLLANQQVYEPGIVQLVGTAHGNTLDNLMTFPRLRKLIERGAVMLHGAYFGVAKGELSVLDRATGEFLPVGKLIKAKLRLTPPSASP